MPYYKMDEVLPTVTSIGGGRGNRGLAAFLTAFLLLVPLVVWALTQRNGDGEELDGVVFIQIGIRMPEGVGISQGTGALIGHHNDHDYIITNRHVLHPPDCLQTFPQTLVILFRSSTGDEVVYQGGEVEIKDAGEGLGNGEMRDLPKDWAIIAFKPRKEHQGRHYFPIGESAALKLDSPVHLYGFPFGTKYTPSAGRGPRPDRGDGTIRQMFDYALVHSIQIDHGHSGGPLVNSNGELVGINTWHEGSGRNAAIPADKLAEVWKDYARRS